MSMAVVEPCEFKVPSHPKHPMIITQDLSPPPLHLLRATIMTLPSQLQLQEFCSFPPFSKAEAVMSQEHRGAGAVRESRKHQETRDRTEKWNVVHGQVPKSPL